MTRARTLFGDNLRLPLICSPMFLASGIELVAAQCKAGVVGTFPALNARPADQLGAWLTQIREELARHDAEHPDRPAAPFGVNLILHRSNDRQDADLATVVEHRVPLVITSVGKPDQVVPRVHAYGGLVFHDVINSEQARKAIDCGVDGLVLVCAGAGGHGGTLSPFSFLREVRRFWDGPIALAGGLADGHAIRAAEVLGADVAYMGTRFIATREANAEQAHKDMLVRDGASDIVYTPVFSGIWANYLANSVRNCGVDPAQLSGRQTGGKDDLFSDPGARPRAWKDVWSSGHGAGVIADVPTVAELVERMTAEYREAAMREVHD
ncbi:Nitronate monooxygenase [compost metagenome]|uniref:Nitronate monooxygenase n=1 Tax=Pseudomonas jinjuensis TaxID=198616 RepID=A0A1H0PDA3_9PSED|nr:nitronate monooxygenase [Pseudomonas jinjuensis]SDP02974.1 nitronate monooxygenase [Pseudomonas jinjuensis]